MCPGVSENPPVSLARGRPFGKNNSGRPRGSLNRTTLLTAGLLNGEAEQLLRKAIEGALSGDATLLKFLLSRALPRDRLITLDLPRIETADDAVVALRQIMEAATQGQITPSEAAALATAADSHLRAIDQAALVKRLDLIEAKLQEGRAR